MKCPRLLSYALTKIWGSDCGRWADSGGISASGSNVSEALIHPNKQKRIIKDWLTGSSAHQIVWHSSVALGAQVSLPAERRWIRAGFALSCCNAPGHRITSLVCYIIILQAAHSPTITHAHPYAWGESWFSTAVPFGNVNAPAGFPEFLQFLCEINVFINRIFMELVFSARLQHEKREKWIIVYFCINRFPGCLPLVYIIMI